jgi:hypothetical protein
MLVRRLSPYVHNSVTQPAYFKEEKTERQGVGGRRSGSGAPSHRLGYTRLPGGETAQASTWEARRFLTRLVSDHVGS